MTESEYGFDRHIAKLQRELAALTAHIDARTHEFELCLQPCRWAVAGSQGGWHGTDKQHCRTCGWGVDVTSPRHVTARVVLQRAGLR